MTRRQVFVRGIVAGLLLGLIYQAVNWLYSGHPDANEIRRIAVIAQAIVSAFGVLWLAHGIPGEPNAIAPHAQGSVESSERSQALNAGGWSKAPHSRDSPSASPVSQNRSA